MEENNKKLKEIATRKKTSKTGNWEYHPKELDEIKSFDELQQIYNNLGLDYIKPVRSKWSYVISDNEFIEKIDKLNTDPENKTEAEKWILKQVKDQAHLIKTVLAGATVVFRD